MLQLFRDLTRYALVGALLGGLGAATIVFFISLLYGVAYLIG